MPAVDSFTGSVELYSYKYPPKGWLFCRGQILEIAKYKSLFNVIGTKFGGDGNETFKLPNIRDRVVIGSGLGENLTRRELGDLGGEKRTDLTEMQLPKHSHKVRCSSLVGTDSTPQFKYPAESSDEKGWYGDKLDGMMNKGILPTVGNENFHYNTMPFLAINFIICVDGANPYEVKTTREKL